ncbi:hypothetical protein BpHYR1_015566 [Brachionus plicatilis]|uniref:Uncharacterized protein n=1 Tax=Brachionus plicatilis TaxID=10195 RepID=A0A3M7S561_BRAPC|nr:hypothetical protein BpHYR1_015566 [Brachionus plicatilis]
MAVNYLLINPDYIISIFKKLEFDKKFVKLISFQSALKKYNLILLAMPLDNYFNNFHASKTLDPISQSQYQQHNLIFILQKKNTTFHKVRIYMNGAPEYIKL